MPAPGTALEDDLRTDLRALEGKRLADEAFAAELYRALTNRRWSRPGAEDAVELSWGQAEALVNVLREEHGHRPLALAGTGGEGWLSDQVADVLRGHGWASRPVLGTRRFAPRVRLRSSAGRSSHSRDDLAGSPSHPAP